MLSAITIFTVIVIFYIATNNIIINKTEDLAGEILNSQQSILNNVFNNVNSASKMLMADDVLQTYLNGSDNITPLQVRKTMANVLTGFSEISDVLLIDLNGELVSLQNKIYSSDEYWTNIYEQEFGEEVVEKRGGYIVANNIIEGKMCLARVVNDLTTQEVIGMLVISFDMERVMEKNYLFPTQDDICMINENGDIIFNRNGDILDIDDIVEKIKSNKADSGMIELKTEVYAYKKLQINDWILIKQFDIEENGKEIYQTLYIAIVMTVCIGIICTFILYFVMNKITVSLEQLLEVVRMFRKGAFRQTDVLSDIEEIQALSSIYNSMAGEIETLIDEKIQQQQLRREAELQVLQEQIKPHFLYNTLNTIGYMVLTEEKQAAYGSLQSLSNYYRKSLSCGNEVITVGEEIEITKEYLSLLRLRYKSLFDIKIFEDEEITKYPILKLTLQPLVENAVYHGIKPLGVDGLIEVQANMEDDVVVLSVKDNGVGITDSAKKDAYQFDSKENKHFGLKGTFERLYNYYGEKCECFIESEENAGTTIIIKIQK